MNQSTNEQTRRKRKMLLLLPLMVLPFLAIAFWALGGGKRAQNNIDQQQGLNAGLPDAKLPDDDAMTKMGFYDQEEQSVDNKTAEGMNDTGIDTAEIKGRDEHTFSGTTGTFPDGNNPYNYNVYSNGSQSRMNTIGNNQSSEEQIKQKLRQLQKQLDEAESNGNNNNLSDEVNLNRHSGVTGQSAEIDKLTSMLKGTGQAEEIDPEIGQLQKMMDRIYDIQHPELVNERIKEKSVLNRGNVFAVGQPPQASNISLLDSQNFNIDSAKTSRGFPFQNGFFGLDEIEFNVTQTDAGIAAVVQDNSTVVNGSTVKMRLLQDIYLNGVLIPAGNFINGLATLTNDRVSIEIKSLLYDSHLFQVQLTAYDMDGMEGIYVPGSIQKEVIRQSGDNALQSIGMGTIDPSLGAQATAAGIETARSLMSKKVKQVKVFIKAGHHILLKDNNTNP
jgi:conjugative transposon TraM protein